MGRAYCSFLAIALVCSACEAPGRDVFVDVRTDIVPLVEFARIETDLFEPGSSFEDGRVARGREHTVAAADNFIRAARVAEFADVEGSTARLRVRMFDVDGRILEERLVVAALDSSTVVTILISRDCLGVTCPAPAGDPTALACIGGRCAPPECTLETSELCPDSECTTATDCPTPRNACADAECIAGICFQSPSAMACSGEERCHPSLGCLPPEMLSDAGPTDAGPDDAGAPDAGSTDAGAGGSVLLRGFHGLEDVVVNDVTADSTGRIFLVGAFAGTSDLGEGPVAAAGQDAFVASYFSDGSVAWVTPIPGMFAEATTVAHDGTRVLVAGAQDGAAGRDLWLRSFDPSDGSPSGMNLFEGVGPGAVTSISAGPTATCIAGENSSVMCFDPPCTPVNTPGLAPFISCYRVPSGSHLWHIDLERPAIGSSSAAMVVGTTVVWIGEVLGPVSLGAGTAIGTGANAELFAAGFDAATGVHAWSTAWPSSESPRSAAATVTASGDILFGGTYTAMIEFAVGRALPAASPSQAFLVRIEPRLGTIAWVSAFGGSDVDGATAVEPRGGVAFSSNTPGGIAVANVDLEDGSVTTVARFSSDRSDVPTGIARDPGGSLYVTGTHRGPIAEIGLPYTAMRDSFLIRGP